jgi:hypothetical protein
MGFKGLDPTAPPQIDRKKFKLTKSGEGSKPAFPGRRTEAVRQQTSNEKMQKTIIKNGFLVWTNEKKMQLAGLTIPEVREDDGKTPQLCLRDCTRDTACFLKGNCKNMHLSDHKVPLWTKLTTSTSLRALAPQEQLVPTATTMAARRPRRVQPKEGRLLVC